MPHSRKVLSAGTLAEFKVENTARESLGVIKDLMIDLATGTVAYVVLSYGGVLGMGEKLFAIPWNKLQPDPKGMKSLFPKEKFDNARGFNKEQRPDEINPDWRLQM